MNDFKKKSVEDLAKLLTEKKEEVRVFRFDVAGSAKKNVKSAMIAKKDIARILTEINSRKTQNV